MQKYKFLFSILFILNLLSTSLIAQNSTKLNGAIIGTQEAVDYATGEKTTTINTIHNVFDDDFNTYFASYERSGTWVGLDLGKEHVITKIGFAPRNGQKSRVQLAVIEGANNPDFGDAISLYIIPEAAEENKMTFVDVKCTRGFRYVRYVTPHNVRCNLSELQFFGYEGKGDDSQLYQLTQIPVVSIHTVNSEDVVIKKLYLKGIIKIISENGTHFFTDSTQIRGRGNASWSFPKKTLQIETLQQSRSAQFSGKGEEMDTHQQLWQQNIDAKLIGF